jgi:hypothetical protein
VCPRCPDVCGARRRTGSLDNRDQAI